MSTTTNRLSVPERGTQAAQHANAAGLLGLVARGILYLVLSGLAVELAVRDGGEQVDSRGALHDLARTAPARSPSSCSSSGSRPSRSGTPSWRWPADRRAGRSAGG